MTNNYLVDFYNTILTLETGLLAISAAIIFVLFQLVYSSFSLREVNLLLKNKYFGFYIGLHLFAIILTAGSSLLLSSSHNFLPLNLYTNTIIMNQWWPVLILILLFIVGYLFIQSLKQVATFLNPAGIALLISSRIKPRDIRNFILNKFGVKNPSNLFMLSRYMKYIENNELEKVEFIQEDFKKENQKNNELYERTKLEVLDYDEDPLLPLVELAQRSLIKSDIVTFKKILECYCDISQNFVLEYSTEQNAGSWSPDQELLPNFIEHILNHMQSLQEIIHKEDLYSAEKEIIILLRRIALGIIGEKKLYLSTQIIKFIKQTANKSIGLSPEVFKECVNVISDIGEKLVELDENGSVNDVSDEVFRSLGWVGERLIETVPIEKKPMMSDFDYETELDVLINRLLGFGLSFRNKYPNTYPLIYFDALDVIRLQIIDKMGYDDEIKNIVYSLTYELFSFGEAAIFAKNRKGVDLSVSRIVRAYREFSERNLDEYAKDTIADLVRIGALIACYQDTLEGDGFLEKDLESYIIQEIANSPWVDKIAYELHEATVKVSPGKIKDGKDLVWKYIVKLGKAMNTNFNFMFDWSTGELYSPNDPRRK